MRVGVFSRIVKIITNWPSSLSLQQVNVTPEILVVKSYRKRVLSDKPQPFGGVLAIFGVAAFEPTKAIGDLPAS